MSLFVLNGYEDLESFCEIQEKDLDYLGLTDPEHRAKILAAVQVLQDFESNNLFKKKILTINFFYEIYVFAYVCVYVLCY